MIEREFVAQKTKEYYIKKYIEEKLNRVGISQIRLKKIPLGEKIIIDTSRPSLVVGSKGANIKDLTKVLKTKFNLENPQVEINEVRNPFLDANIVAEQIANSLERFGSARFKGVGHKMMGNVIRAGAMGVEIIISGKIPGARAKSWRFYQGYLKKCGDIAVSGVRKAQKSALLKSGIIGIKVAIMPPNLILPDKIEVREEPILPITEAQEEKEEQSEEKVSKKKTAAKKPARKRASKKKEEKQKEDKPKKSEEKKKKNVEETAKLELEGASEKNSEMEEGEPNQKENQEGKKYSPAQENGSSTEEKPADKNQNNLGAVEGNHKNN